MKNTKHKSWLTRFLGVFIMAFFFIPTQSAHAAAPLLADDVLGQSTGGSPDFTTYDTNDISTPNITGLDAPWDVEIDETLHLMFIVEEDNNRVVVHQLDSSNNVIDRTADYVFGQPDFVTATSGTTQSTLNAPDGLALDTANTRLFVADTANHRVMVFDYSSITNGENAINVLGDSIFTDGASGLTQSQLNEPIGIDYDPATNYLYVGEENNDRIMVFDVTSITDGENAINVLGAPDFTTGGSSITANEIDQVHGLAVDSSGQRLFATDRQRARVLVYDIASITDGEAAVNVLGPSDFTSSGPTDASDQATVYSPYGVTYDESGDRLFVSSGFRIGFVVHYRVAVFDVASITDGENAVNMLGKADFSGNVFAGNAGEVTSPRSGDVVGTKLYISDIFRNRVLVYDIASITDGEDAVDVFGQTDGSSGPNFTISLADDLHPSSSGLFGPNDMLTDPIHNRLYISDENNCRVLVHYLDAGNNLVDRAADAVLGQANMYESSCHVSETGQSSLSSTRGLALDNDRQLLFVSNGGRISVFDVASISNGENAVYVLGKPDFTSSTNGPTQSLLSLPADIAFDQDRNLLFVSDVLDERVVVYDTTTIANGMNATYVLGHSDFTSSGANLSQSGVDDPYYLAYDHPTKHLYISDFDNNRVLIFDTTTITNGMNATHVLGQTGFSSNSWSATSASSVGAPGGITIDEDGRRVYVQDSFSYRVSVFDIANITNNEDAVAVFGQSDLTSDAYGSTSNSFNSGFLAGVHYDDFSRKLYASDPDFNRILVLDIARITTSSLPSAEEGQAYSKTLSHANEQGSVTFALDSGSLPSGITLSSAGVLSGTPTAQGTFSFTIRINDDNGTAGTFSSVQELSLKVTGPDVDSDGVEDAVEDAGPNGGDANGDGTADSAQNNVSTNVNTVASGYTTVATSTGNVENYTIVDESSLPTQSSENFPLGLNEFAVSGLTAGASVDITVYYDQEYDTSSWVFMKYNRVTQTYTDISSIVTYGIQNIGGTTITTATYSVTDGGQHDEDGLANGTVVDPAGPAVLELSATGSSSLNAILIGVLIVSAALASTFRTSRKVVLK